MANLPDKENQGRYLREMFNSIAYRYDLMNKIMTLGRDKSWRRFAVIQSGLKAGGYGLDVCCGTGMLTIEQARLVGPTGKIIGIDISENMLTIARKNINKNHLAANIQLIQGDVLDLPLKGNIFDCVMVSWGLKNVTNILTAVKEMTRVVKPGGKVISLDMGQPRQPVFKELYWFCFKKIIPVLGRIWGKNREAYEYLYDSSRIFLAPEELIAIFKQAGLVETTFHNLFLGAVTIVTGRKALENE